MAFPQNIIWMPQPGSQQIFLAADEIFEVLLEGNRGGGKTDALIMAFCKHVDKGYGAFWQGIIFRQPHKQLKDVIKKSKKWIPRMFPGAEFNETDKVWKFKDGEELRFAHMRVPSDYENYHGHEYPFIGWEELTTWSTDECYTRMMSCCRSSGPSDMPRIVRATTNPYGAGFHWVKKRFRLPSQRFQVWREKEIDQHGRVSYSKTRLAIQSRLSENKILLAMDPDYVKTLKTSARNEMELKAWIFGSWDIVAGGMFGDVWSEDTHVIEPFKIPRAWKIYRALDWGSAAPFSVGWYAESNGSPVGVGNHIWGDVEGDVFRIGEWYGTTGKPNEGLGLTGTEVGEGILERELEFPHQGNIHRRVRPGPADHNIFGDGTKGVKNIHDEMRKSGIRFDKAVKGPGSRKVGWQVARDYMANAMPLEIGSRIDPGLYIFNNCWHFINLVPTLPRDDGDLDDIDPVSEDHIGDELRYFLRRTRRRMANAGF